MDVALVGAGNVVRALYLPLLSTPDPLFRVRSVFDVDGAAAQHVAHALGARAAPSLREALDDDRVRAVFVCTPKEWHAEAVHAALDRSLHVLCEKPLGRDGAEAVELWRAAEGAGVAHMVNFAYRFRAGPAAARALLRAGAIGRVYHLHGTLAQGRWFTAQGLPARERRDATPWRYGPTGGVVSDLGPHVVDFCAPLGDVLWTQAWTSSLRAAEQAAEDVAGLSLGFAGGAVAHLLVSRWATGHHEKLSIEVAGSDGSVVFDRAGARLWTRHSPEWTGAPAVADRTFLTAFHAAVRGDGTHGGATFRDAAANALVVDAILRGARSGQVERPLTVTSPEGTAPRSRAAGSRR
ncbi:Gfo/Idh/MocA family protein [Phytohabitans suffuscus]|uniref:Gfo/Idh/MocA family protein n=1 Tax=Phytohabitans suffuscus TaxID=624315 RepID=UPI001565B40E|nr:Gfo/Idh/MocA family oxidoreductase [Phytohabitans suffuscus]